MNIYIKKKECSCKFTCCNVTTGVCFLIWSDGNNCTGPPNCPEGTSKKITCLFVVLENSVLSVLHSWIRMNQLKL
jgi:hypothetical protein